MNTTLRWTAAAVAVVLVAAWESGCKKEDDGTDNLPPEITSAATTDATVYAEYFYQILCADPENEPVTLALGGDDTCNGVFADYGNGAGTYVFTPEIDLSGGSCVMDLYCMDTDLYARQTITISVAPPTDIGDLTFGEFVEWARPIEDYIQINADILGHHGFFRDIHDLTVFEDKLHFGYGDADLNLGRNTPIQVRFWEREIPEAVETDFTVNEEQISHYRIFEDMLIIPGVDATEDNLLGNAYTLQATGMWRKSRSLQLGWHVHDAAVVDGAIYACGSGGTMDDYNNSTVNAFLWRSDDNGKAFTIDTQIPHPNPPGDHRLTSLLVVSGTLYAFGYYSSGGQSYAIAYELTGTGLQPWTGSQDFFVTDTVHLSADVGLLVGVKIQSPLVWGGLLVTSTGVQTAPILEGITLLDAEPLGDGRTLLLYIQGDEYPTPPQDPWTFHVALTTDGTDRTEILSQTVETGPVSIAFWRRSLFLGMDDGSVWRATGADL